MAIYKDPQNRAQEEGAALIPDMPGYSDFKEKPFSKMKTEEDQIWWLYWHFKNLADTTDYETLLAELKALKDEMGQMWDALDDLRAKLADLLCEFYSLATNALTYDVTKGLYTSSMAQARREWQAQMFYGMTVADLATFTVADAGSMNVRHVAVDGRLAYMGIGQADPEIPYQDSYGCPKFNPDAYVRKDELTLIDTDNLEAHEIMGVLTADAQSDFIQPVAYARRYTAEDLANSYVLYNDHVATDYIGRDLDEKGE